METILPKMKRPSDDAVATAMLWLVHRESHDSLTASRLHKQMRAHAKHGETADDAATRILVDEIGWLRDKLRQDGPR